MQNFITFIDFLSSSGDRPEPFGQFHIAAMLLTLILSIATILLLKDAEGRKFRIAMLGIWLILAVLEVLRELVLAYTVSPDGSVEFIYEWYLFPYQLCSSPLYLLPLLALLPNGRGQDAVAAFLASFSLIGGIAVVIYPPEVLSSTAFLNYQAFIHHGLQIVIGVLCAVRLIRKHDNLFKVYFGGMLTFVIMAAIALLLNHIIHGYLEANGTDQIINLFYISPYYKCVIPVLSEVWESYPYPIFLALYLLGFSAAAAIILYLQKGLFSLASRGRSAIILLKKGKGS